ncbi:MAG: MotA/TolQ/ExbB proton channel family protein [Gammaproteobacteria bacterium]|nr:MotA/TolQ/ExbB proton channel family protein [Gammaproteobacteria bacterium]
MLYQIEELFDIVRNFMGTGGDVLYIIAFVLVVMWTFIIERVWYQNFTFPRDSRQMIARWTSRSDVSSWKSLRIRDCWISQSKESLNQNLMLIKTLVAICPMVGLLGTVTGMITVFETMATHGTGNPRLMAAGISMATIPTMAGMVAALSGLFVSTRLEASARTKTDYLADRMPRH